MNDIDNVFVSLVCNDTLCVIIKFFFTVRDVFFDMSHQFGIKLQLLPDHFIPLEQLDRIPAQIVAVDFILNAFLNMSESMFHASAINMRNISVCMMFCKINGFLCRIQSAFSFQSADLHTGAVKRFSEFFQIDLIPVFPDKVDHIDSKNDRMTKL